MRTVCAACSELQPADWKPGDLCVWCGQSVRPENRCYWCVKWTPSAQYCRSCGAEQVDPHLYPAARMLKDAGVDRFSLAHRLRELDPRQVATLTSIYQEHAGLVANLVDQLRFVEQHLHQRIWSERLNEKLTAELPWGNERRDEVREVLRFVPPALEGADRLSAIQKHAPDPLTRSLAAVALLGLDDWEMIDACVGLLYSGDQPAQWEAALALSHWRLLYGPGLVKGRREVIAALQTCPLREQAAVRLACLGVANGTPLPPEDFGAALVLGDIDRLAQAAKDGDPLERFAAAQRLIDCGAAELAQQAIRESVPQHQVALLKLIGRAKKPVPELRPLLFDIAETTADRDVRHYACDLLCLGCPPEDVGRLARAAQGEMTIHQSILQRAGLPPESLREFGEFLADRGLFKADQYGMRDVAKQDRMPAGFVQKAWPAASSKVRVQLLRFAELQLESYGDEDLHRFLVDVAFTPGDPGVQSEAWTVLYRWYDSFGFPRRRPVAISPEAMERFFGSAEEFLRRLDRFFHDGALFTDSLQRDHITQLLSYPDARALPLLAAVPREALTLARTFAEVMRQSETDFSIRLACADGLGFLGQVPKIRAEVIALLESFRVTDMALQSERALGCIARSQAATAGSQV